ncbi:MAG TPA: MFS transporter [Vicinamibacteria bacterium]|nr:MFS transporter [Vicinamibacteria bacterium]
MIPAARAVLLTASLTHVVHDGFSDVLYVLLPLWAAEFDLTLTGVGVLKTVYTAGMALSQIPAGLLAERWGERRLLVVGTAVTALGYLAVAMASSAMLPLLGLLLAAGLGSGVQHPLASSLVSRAYETGPRRAALGTYNFAGDLGKIAVPAVVALGASLVGWRSASAGYALLGLGGAVLIALVLGRLGAGDADAATEELRPGIGGWGIRDARGFQALSAIGMIDTATRTALLTFLPFLLLAKGLTVAGLGLALAVLFAGGAAGKFVCGLVAERVGIVRTVILTELATACGIVAVALGPRALALGLLLPLGVALNGTSSALYATVADLVAPERRARAYGLYYTLVVGASAVAPLAYGALGDAVGILATLLVTAAVVLITVPLCLVLRGALAPAGGVQLPA